MPDFTKERALEALGRLSKHARAWHGMRRDGNSIELACMTCPDARKLIALSIGDDGLYRSMLDFMTAHEHPGSPWLR